MTLLGWMGWSRSNARYGNGALWGAELTLRRKWMSEKPAMAVSAEFEVDDSYEGGVFYQDKPNAEINHEVSLVGWGKDPETNEE